MDPGHVRTGRDEHVVGEGKDDACRGEQDTANDRNRATDKEIGNGRLRRGSLSSYSRSPGSLEVGERSDEEAHPDTGDQSQRDAVEERCEQQADSTAQPEAETGSKTCDLLL
jgi:hypothetical protein